MDVTNRWVLDFGAFRARTRRAKILDYGAGAGGGRARGRLEMFGAEIYYGGSETRREAEQTDCWARRSSRFEMGGAVRDSTFDLSPTTSMEHVETGGVLWEIRAF